MSTDERIKASVCDECAQRMGLTPIGKAVGVWIGDCDFCGERKPLTSLLDWRKGEKDGK